MAYVLSYKLLHMVLLFLTLVLLCFVCLFSYSAFVSKKADTLGGEVSVY